MTGKGCLRRKVHQDKPVSIQSQISQRLLYSHLFHPSEKNESYTRYLTRRCNLLKIKYHI